MRIKAILSLNLLICILAGSACSKSTSAIPEGIPPCLNNTLLRFKNGHCSTGLAVKEYKFQNKTVYLFEPGHCGADMESPVVDGHCNMIGALGGIAGNTFINGEDFSNAVLIKTI